MTRKLASVQKIKAIKPIEGADRIEVAQVLNWDCVVRKGEYQVGDIVIYFEIDSLLPDIPAFEFLKGSSWSQKLNKYKISTHKFRNQISQGLVIPIHQIYEILEQLGLYKENRSIPIELEPDRGTLGMTEKDFKDGDGWNLTEWLKVEKYEPPVSNGALGEIISHEWYVPKTDEERIQVCAETVLPKYMKAESNDWYTSVKLDGTSCTFGLYDDGFYIAGRNQFYKGPNMYTETVRKYKDIEEKLKYHQEKTGQYIIFQGELCGPGIQGNKLGLEEKEIFVFNAFASDTGKIGSYEKLGLYPTEAACEEFELNMVPIVKAKDKFDFKNASGDIDHTVENLLNYVDKFKYRTYFENASPSQIAEGMVFRKIDMTDSFKVVSNKYLLKNGD